MLTPFFPTAQEARNIANATGRAAREVFNQHHDLRRFGTSILIRLVERNNVRGIQVALFCPWDTHDWVKRGWRDYEWRMRIWKDRVVAAVDEWATRNNVVILEGYTGGSRPVRKDRDPDSMEMSAAWLLDAIRRLRRPFRPPAGRGRQGRGSGMGGTLPLPEDPKLAQRRGELRKHGALDCGGQWMLFTLSYSGLGVRDDTLGTAGSKNRSQLEHRPLLGARVMQPMIDFYLV